MNNKVLVYIEIEKNSNIEYKYNKIEKSLIINNVLDTNFVYPYSYLFIANIESNIESNAFIITDKEIKNNEYYETYIIGLLAIEYEKKMNEIFLCVLEEDYFKIKDVNDLNDKIKDKIYNFFEDYIKDNNIPKKLKVIGYFNKNIALKIFNESITSKIL